MSRSDSLDRGREGCAARRDAMSGLAPTVAHALHRSALEENIMASRTAGGAPVWAHYHPYHPYAYRFYDPYVSPRWRVVIVRPYPRRVIVHDRRHRQ